MPWHLDEKSFTSVALLSEYDDEEDSYLSDYLPIGTIVSEFFFQ